MDIADATFWLKIGVFASFFVVLLAAIAGQADIALCAAVVLVVGIRMQKRAETRRLHGIRRRRRRRS